MGAQTFVLDLAYVFPGAQSYLSKGSATVQYAASEEMERMKPAKYRRVVSGWNGMVFVPFVIGDQWTIGEERREIPRRPV